MDSIVWESALPELRSPVLVGSFSAWNDASTAASTALAAIAAELEEDLTPVAQIDPEEFFDFQANRPTIEIDGGSLSEVSWPDNQIVGVRVPDASRDLLLISGTEPSMRWRSFCNAVLDVGARYEVESVVTFGSLIADVAHTRPVPITGMASDDELVAELGFEDVGYEGPTGVLAVFHEVCRERGISIASLWAAVPHYAAAVPNPKAGLALLRQLEELIGVPFEAADLEVAARSFEAQVTQAVAANPEISELVERLEEQQDEVASFTQEELPSGDSIAREFQRFLRDQQE